MGSLGIAVVLRQYGMLDTRWGFSISCSSPCKPDGLPCTDKCRIAARSGKLDTWRSSEPSFLGKACHPMIVWTFDLWPWCDLFLHWSLAFTIWIYIFCSFIFFQLGRWWCLGSRAGCSCLCHSWIISTRIWKLFFFPIGMFHPDRLLVTDKRNRRSASWFFRLTVHNPSNGYSNWQNHPLWANINFHSQWSAGTPAQLATWNPLLLLITYKSFLPSWCIFWKTALRPYFQNFYGGVEHSDQPTISIH